MSKLTPLINSLDTTVHPLVRGEVSSFLDNLQDAIEDGEETEEYSEIEVNPGKFRVLHGRLKGICRRLDNFSKGYLLSSLVHSGLANNPFILEELDLSGALCTEEQFVGADLSRMVARGINFKAAILSEARMENVKMSFAVLTSARLDDAKMSGAYLNEAEMQACYLKGADLTRSYLIGSDLRNSYMGEANLDAAILRQANLEGANLSFCHMFATNLSEANLSKTVIRESNMQGATLSETNLESCYLVDSDLESADLWKANLSKAILLGSNFQKAYLNETKFFGIYQDIVESKDLDLDKLQEKGTMGLYSSGPIDKYGVTKKTNFAECQWWKAEFDKASAGTLWKYLNANFAPPNGMDLSETEWQEFRDAEKKINQILSSKK
ncbi:MAG: pentapeptide repeat-containing protein [Candidatus Caenarcaniphilales bacterium]|nr:pentapeptide repeat-containing protein [Candidatus Caenarcaniphilales bacterium]